MSTFAVLSREAVASSLPSLLKTQQRTCPTWPVKQVRKCPDSSHNYIYKKRGKFRGVQSIKPCLSSLREERWLWFIATNLCLWADWDQISHLIGSLMLLVNMPSIAHSHPITTVTPLSSHPHISHPHTLITPFPSPSLTPLPLTPYPHILTPYHSHHSPSHPHYPHTLSPHPHYPHPLTILTPYLLTLTAPFCEAVTTPVPSTVKAQESTPSPPLCDSCEEVRAGILANV